MIPKVTLSSEHFHTNDALQVQRLAGVLLCLMPLEAGAVIPAATRRAFLLPCNGRGRSVAKQDRIFNY